jgi:hypothetical protein
MYLYSARVLLPWSPVFPSRVLLREVLPRGTPLNVFYIRYKPSPRINLFPSYKSSAELSSIPYILVLDGIGLKPVSFLPREPSSYRLRPPKKYPIYHIFNDEEVCFYGRNPKANRNVNSGSFAFYISCNTCYGEPIVVSNGDPKLKYYFLRY